MREPKHNSPNFNFSTLDINFLHLAVFTDASFEKSRTFFIVEICLCSIRWSRKMRMWYRSLKSQRVARSALGAERFALSHAFDMGSTPKVSLNSILDKELQLKLYNQCRRAALKSFFDASIGINELTEKRLVIDPAVIRQSYKRR